MPLDETHDPARKSFVASANIEGCDFPIQNLPFGVGVVKGGAPSVVVAIGDCVLPVVAAADMLGFAGAARRAAEACRTGTLNGLAALGREAGRALRRELGRVLEAGTSARARDSVNRLLAPLAACELRLPFAIGDFSDFYTSIEHAENLGRMFRPDSPLLPNYKWVPIGYHGRASSVIASGTPFVRPCGQRKAPDAAQPSFGPSARLDYEVELGFFIGRGNALGRPIALADALEHVFGAVLLCDWSARDIQAWEYQPLGPFLAKSFATTISPWVVTLDALEPFRCPARVRADGDPAPLPYLDHAADRAQGGFDIEVEMALQSAAMRAQALAPQRLSRASYRGAYWTVGQIVTHHASNGCNLQSGDLLGSGTISGSAPDAVGSLMELARGGAAPVALASGESRAFLADGDLLIQRGRCARAGYATIGFGEARALVLPAAGG